MNFISNVPWGRRKSIYVGRQGIGLGHDWQRLTKFSSVFCNAEVHDFTCSSKSTVSLQYALSGTALNHGT